MDVKTNQAQSAENTRDFRKIAAVRQGQLLISALLSIIASTLGLVPFVAIYLITIHIFQNDVSGTDTRYVLIVAAISLFAILGKSLAMGSSLHISHIAAYDILYETRLELARKLSTMPLGFFDRRNTGALKRILHENVEKMETGLAHVIPEMAAAVTVPVVTLFVLFFVDWRLALVLLCSPILGLIFFGFMMRVNMSAMKTYHEIVDRMNSTIIQYINGMKVIKAFTRSRASFSDLKKVINDMSVFMVDMGNQAQNSFSAMNIAFRTGPLFVLPVGLLMYANGTLEMPVLLLFLIVSLGFGRPIFNLLMHGSMAFYQIDTAMKRIDKLLLEPALVEPEQPQKPNGNTITFNHVSFSYGRLDDLEDDEAKEADEEHIDMESPRVLDDVSFTIPQGTVTALVGPSGAGKTTISRLIPRFWDVDEGSIEIGGVDIRDMGTAVLMDTVSFVFQDVFLFNDTIYENIRVGNVNASREQVIAAAKLAHCHDFIEELGGYDYHIGENGAKLSGGERQRISIARAILKNAPIIVLDEATAFVDPENEGQIQEALASLMNSDPNNPKTLVVVAHRLSTITEVDQILLVDEGEIADSGTHVELLANNALYQTLWQAHTDASQWQFDPDANVETVAINRNTTYDAEYEPLENPFEALKTADGHWARIRALVGDETRLYRHSIVWSFLEGGFIAYPAVIIYLALLALYQNNFNTNTVILLTSGLFLIFLGQFFFNKKAYMSFLHLDTRIQRNLRVFLSDFLRRLPLGFFSKRDVGYIDALFTTTIDFIETRISTALFMAGVVSPIIVFVFTLFIDWRMALAMAASIPFAYIIIKKAMGVFDQVWQAQREALKKANGRMVEYIQGISVIRAFNLPGERFEQFEVAMDRFRIASRETATKISPAMIGFSSVLEIGFTLLLIVGVALLLNGTLSFEIFLIFMILGTSFYLPILGLADMLSFQRVVANGVNNINEFLKSPMLPEPNEPQKPNGYHIAFDNVHFSYEDEKVLDNVSFEIPQNAMVALVGPSGSGKTTITNLIARFWDVDEGSVKVGGVDVRKMTSDALLSQITMVFQNVYLFNDTIMNNIRFANPAATDEQVFAAARLARAHDFIVEMPNGYDSMVGEGGSTLSGGQKQRISIARALLKDAPIVLLDEATASIDPENERLIQQAFNVLVKQKTVIIIAHRLSTVQTADKILVLKNGTLIEQGNHEELMAQDGLYNHFWQERQKARGWKLGSAETAVTISALSGTSLKA